MTTPVPVWLTYDPEPARLELDIQGAAADGAGKLIVRYDEEKNHIDVRNLHIDVEAARE
jgi:hypothetical protein